MKKYNEKLIEDYVLGNDSEDYDIVLDATELKEISFLRVIPSQANYFLCEITAKYTARELTKILLERYNILIKDCGTKSAFSGKNYIRIAIRDRFDNSYFVKSLKELI